MPNFENFLGPVQPLSKVPQVPVRYWKIVHLKSDSGPVPVRYSKSPDIWLHRNEDFSDGRGLLSDFGRVASGLIVYVIE